MRLTAAVLAASGLVVALLHGAPASANPSPVGSLEAQVLRLAEAELAHLAVVRPSADVVRLRLRVEAASGLTELLLATGDIFAATGAAPASTLSPGSPPDLLVASPSDPSIEPLSARRGAIATGPRTAGAKGVRSTFIPQTRGTWLPSPDSQ